METQIYVVDGMTCDHCVQAVSGELRQVPGVTDVDVNLDTKVVTVSGDSLDDAALVAAIDEAGYTSVRA